MLICQCCVLGNKSHMCSKCSYTHTNFKDSHPNVGSFFLLRKNCNKITWIKDITENDFSGKTDTNENNANHEKAKYNNAEVNKTGWCKKKCSWTLQAWLGLFKLSTENKGGVFYGMCFHANQ